MGRHWKDREVADREGIIGKGNKRGQNIEIIKCTVYLEVMRNEKVGFERKYKSPKDAD